MKSALKTRKVKNKVMAFDIFERKYQSEIEMMIERILDNKTNLNENNYDTMYDDAHEEAVFVLAKDRNITLE
jgi:hypothetical protein